MNKRKIIVYTLAIILALWTLFPVYWMLTMSISTEEQLASVPPRFIPSPTLVNFERILGFGGYGESGLIVGHSYAVKKGLVNSTIIALVTSMITVPVASLAGYVWGRLKFRFKTGFLFMLLFTRMLPPVAVIIPYFAIFWSAGLIGTYPSMILIYLTITIPLMTWVLMGFFATLPPDIENAARMDGCTRLGALTKVVMPLSAAGIAAVFILSFLAVWNEFLFALIIASGSAVGTLPPALAGMLVQGKTEFTLIAAAGVLSIIPPIIIALLFEKYITQLKMVDPGIIR